MMCTLSRDGLRWQEQNPYRQFVGWGAGFENEDLHEDHVVFSNLEFRARMAAVKGQMHLRSPVPSPLVFTPSDSVEEDELREGCLREALVLARTSLVGWREVPRTPAPDNWSFSALWDGDTPT
eukprot:1999226-Amphidinium_carterae.1